mgnify:CR=1 FL=1
MDTLSHAVWGGGLFGFRGHIWIALFFGAFPDLLSFGLWLPLHMFENGLSFSRPPPLDLIPSWVFISYNLTHSLPVALSAIAVVAWWRPSIAFAMLAWPFHIVLDIPFHSSEFFPTQLFWPFTDYFIDGMPWTQPWVWFSNIAGLLMLWLWRWRGTYAR